MTQAIDRNLDFIPCERGRLSSRIFSQTMPGALALAFSGLFGVWTLYLRPAAAPYTVDAPAAASAVAIASNPYGGLFDPRSASGSTPLLLAQDLPLDSNFEPAPAASSVKVAEQENIQPGPSAATVVAEQENAGPGPADARFGESVPLPVPRPTALGSLESHGPMPAPSRRLAEQDRRSVPPAAPPDNRSFFDKLFGALPQPSGPTLAYAAPEDGLLGNTRRLTSSPPVAQRYDRQTAIYDIASHTVYLPNGTRLEAHSGLGNRLDDPRYVNERMRGATPPNIYQLQPREQLFHGVQALRLIPVGGGDVYGRTGLLAHTFMLGPNGDSNGCVSFRNYNAFLQAYQSGEIRRLAVVTRLN
jgi:hypothetical protein